MLMLDLSITFYQWVCFPIYEIAIVPRRHYLVVDRHKLAYLNGIEKVHCTYCSYATGLFAYAREITARTEQYWCPIKHAGTVPAPHERYHSFVGYGDAEGYRESLPELRRSLRGDRGKRLASPTCLGTRNAAGIGNLPRVEPGVTMRHAHVDTPVTIGTGPSCPSHAA